jgi:hypothetical protein
MNAGFLWRGLAILPLLAALGCSGGGKPVKVEGMVTLDGKALPGAMVQFVPDGEKGIGAAGVTGTDGSFRLTTFSSGDGVLPGTYKVLVSLPGSEDESGSQINPEDKKAMIDAMKQHMEKSKKPKPKKPSLPVTYSDPKKTTLKQVIPPPDGKVTLDLRSSGS